MGDGWGRDRAPRATMTFRTRLLAGFGVVVLVPLVIFGLGIRREMSGRLAAEYERRVGTLAEVVSADIVRQSDAIAARLDALKAVVAANGRLRAALRGGIAATSSTTRATRCASRVSISSRSSTVRAASFRRVTFATSSTVRVPCRRRGDRLW